MNIVVTGAEGFIGSNLCAQLCEQGYKNIIKVDKNTSHNDLIGFLREADFIYHLAGVNRPKNEDEFREGNIELTDFLLQELISNKRKVPVMLSSSIQAEQNNAYGLSKAEAERKLQSYGDQTGSPYHIYRLPNVFGKWCKPNYNSFIATFCHNIVNDIEINIHNPSAPVNLVYIDDVCAELISLLTDNIESGYQKVKTEYKSTVGEVAEQLQAFKNSRQSLLSEKVGTGLTRALYSTYLSYLRPDQFSYQLPSYVDERGAFCEMLKTKESGQFSFFTAHPGVTRGGHYHHSKNEKFLVIKGKALFKFEQIITNERYELAVTGDEFQVIETVPGWSHDITNVGDEDLVVMLWANEIFDRESPDTFARPL
ncbi:capsular biosynthesis protein [Endozoicomonas montiporae]|uniref:Capsular biosynthesis protein n=2 Tax=Endozoicomonas montiporae TaxID=1027273 RepID=A0A081NCA7_9GAMM|nr:capsular biosynthesis protein [Endozoicomonas montiporae]